MAPNAEDRRKADLASDLISTRLRHLVLARPSSATSPPPRAQGWLDELLSRNDTYRDATLAILAFPVAANELIDIRVAPPSRRGVTQHLTRVCEELSIPCKKDAFQTLGKGNIRLDGLEREAWRNLLAWASTGASLDDVRTAFDYFAEGMALLARPLPRMPTLIIRALTYPRVCVLFDRMLARPSKGAHEQFIVAALLAEISDQEGSLRAETKPLNAADASARTVADIQIWRHLTLEEAFETTGMPWRDKIRQAAALRARADIQRVHIVANAPDASGANILAALRNEGLEDDVDLSILDVYHEVRSMLARLRRQNRASALSRLYEYLQLKQPDDNLVIEYVQALNDLKLTE